MSLNKVEEMVELYLNGNISDFKKWLKENATKQDVLNTVGTLLNYWWTGTGASKYEDFAETYLRAMNTVSRYLK